VGLFAIWGGYVVLTGERQHVIAISLSTLVLASKWRLITATSRHFLLLALFLSSLILGMLYLRATYGRKVFTDMTASEMITVISEEKAVEKG